MTTTEVASKFARLESELARKSGGFALFALFMREEVPDRWDLMVSAPWIGSDRPAALNYLVGEIKNLLGADYLTALSRIIIVDPSETEMQDFNRAFVVEHGNVEVSDTNFFGLPIKHAHIITSKRREAPVAG